MGVLLVVALSACGSGGDDRPQGQEAPAAESTTETTAYIESEECRDRAGALLDAVDLALDDTTFDALRRRVEGFGEDAEAELVSCSQEVLTRTIGAVDKLVEAVDAGNRGRQKAVTEALIAAQGQATAARLSLDKTA